MTLSWLLRACCCRQTLPRGVAEPSLTASSYSKSLDIAQEFGLSSQSVYLPQGGSLRCGVTSFAVLLPVI